MKSYIFIDGSYFIYHRYFSLVRWWKLSNPENDNDEQTHFSQNSVFVDKFKKIFLESIHSLPKKIHQLGATIIVGKDCKKENIWRKQFYQEYKATRQHNEDISFFMALAYNELFIKPHISRILFHPSLEADDCIAIYIKDIISSSQPNTIYIITSDKDYLQLMAPNIHIFDSKYTDLTKQKSSFGSAEKNLFCKIIMGDTSDNIPSVFTKCGAITAAKLYDNPTSFQEKLSREKANDKWKLNQLLVDFNYIPTHYREEFNITYKKSESEQVFIF